MNDASIRRRIALACDDILNWEKYTLSEKEVFYEGNPIAKYHYKEGALYFQLYQPVKRIDLTVSIKKEDSKTYMCTTCSTMVTSTSPIDVGVYICKQCHERNTLEEV